MGEHPAFPQILVLCMVLGYKSIWYQSGRTKQQQGELPYSATSFCEVSESILLGEDMGGSLQGYVHYILGMEIVSF